MRQLPPGRGGLSDEDGAGAELVLGGGELDETLRFFLDRLSFRLEAIFPADAPTVAVISGHGLRIRLEAGGSGAASLIRLVCHDPTRLGAGEVDLVAPNGTRIELVDAEAPLVLPPLQPAFALSRIREARWSSGRAGMQYRDLIPDRQGGAFVASHIRITDGGPVPDYVHFHDVRFQAIYCYQGWVRVVYEDQGPAFLLRPGDCVLQPPKIRHRVLECSAGMEVIEVSCPAEHETRVDHELALPNPDVQPAREFGGQRFCRHEAAAATWRAHRLAGFEVRDTGVAAATAGLAGVRVARRVGPEDPAQRRHDGELSFAFVLRGAVRLVCEGRTADELEAGDAFVVPAGLAYRLADGSPDLELLEVALPAGD